MRPRRSFLGCLVASVVILAGALQLSGCERRVRVHVKVAGADAQPAEAGRETPPPGGASTRE